MNNDNTKTNLGSVLGERLFNGLLKENPTFVLLLGMCPTLAVTTSAMNGLGMGATTLVVLALSNMMISALRKIIPDKIRIPAFIVIIASFVTIVELLLNAYIPSLYDALGLYIPLIVVNCIILGRAEAYAYSNPVLPSLFDGLGMGAGFTVALTIIGSFREILGSGTIFGARVMPAGYIPVSIFVMAPGAFFVLALLTAIQNAVKIAGTKRGKDMSKIQSGCGGNCLECNKECKVSSAPSPTEESVVDEPETVETKVTKAKEAKPENIKTAEVKTETVKVEESKSEDVKKEAVKTEEVKSEEVKSEEIKSEEAKTEEVKVEEVKAEKIKVEEVKSEEVKTEEVKTEEIKAESVKEDKPSEPENVEDDLELIDLNEYRNAVKKTPKKPVRKKTSMAKAKAMLSKADETLKEDENND